MIRFSKIIEKDSKEDSSKRPNRKGEISLRKIGFLDKEEIGDNETISKDNMNEINKMAACLLPP